MKHVKMDKKSNIEKFKEIKTKIKPKEEEYEPGMPNELEFLRRKYRQYKEYEERYYQTNYFKKRIITVFILIFGIFITLMFTPQNPEAGQYINEFSYVFMILFILLVAFIDQLIIGLYFYKKQKKEKKVIR